MLAVIGMRLIILLREAILHQNLNKLPPRNYSKEQLSCCNRYVIANLRCAESCLNDIH